MFISEKVTVRGQFPHLESLGKIHIFLTRSEILIIHEVSGVYTFQFLDTDELKMALRAREVSGAFEKRAQKSYEKIPRKN